MAKVSIPPTWTAFTTGSNNGILSPEGCVLLYIGTAAPAATEAGIPFNREKIQVGPPAQSWIKSGDGSGNSVSAVQFNY